MPPVVLCLFRHILIDIIGYLPMQKSLPAVRRNRWPSAMAMEACTGPSCMSDAGEDLQFFIAGSEHDRLGVSLMQ